MVKRASFRLADEAMFDGKAVSDFKSCRTFIAWSSRCFVSATNSEDFVLKGSSF